MKQIFSTIILVSILNKVFSETKQLSFGSCNWDMKIFKYKPIIYKAIADLNPDAYI